MTIRHLCSPFCISSTKAEVLFASCNFTANNEILTDNPIAVLPRSFESLLEQSLELLVSLTVNTTKDLDVLQRQLERRSFKANVPRRVRQHEAEVDVDEVTASVNEDVSVMSVFDLEEIRDD